MKTLTDRLAIYPGSFDPFTLGHLDVAERASRLFDRLEIAVAVNRSKQPFLSVEERCELIEECTRGLENVVVSSFEGLLVDHARLRGAKAVVRGLRQVSDFDFEFRMAFANRRLHKDLETIFLMTTERHALIHSSIVREVHAWGGDISSFVPGPVLDALTPTSGRLPAQPPTP